MRYLETSLLLLEQPIANSKTPLSGKWMGAYERDDSEADLQGTEGARGRLY
jgi:hypothetical protein